VPNLQAIAGRAFALAAANEFEGPRRNIERVGIRAVDLITAIPDLRNGERPCATSPRVQPRCDASRARPASDHLKKSTQPVSGYSIFTFISETNRQTIGTICHWEYHV
jgi:hypothetical protein